MPRSISSFVTPGTNPRTPTTSKITPKRTAIVLTMIDSFVDQVAISTATLFKVKTAAALRHPRPDGRRAPCASLGCEDVDRRERKEEIGDQCRRASIIFGHTL